MKFNSSFGRQGKESQYRHTQIHSRIVCRTVLFLVLVGPIPYNAPVNSWFILQKDFLSLKYVPETCMRAIKFF